MKSINLRAYQIDAIQQARDRIAAGRVAPLLVAPTGSGKTVILAEMVRLHLDMDPSHRVLVVAHRVELIGQIARTILRSGIHDIGEIVPGVTQRPRARVQVASTQTLRARGQFPEATMMIADECVTGDTDVAGRRADAIRVGDLVDSWDGIRCVKRRVSRVFVNQASSLLVIRAGSRTLTCTPAHPIWIGGKGFVYASEVRAGDVCRLRKDHTARRKRTPVPDVQPRMQVGNLQASRGKSVGGGKSVNRSRRRAEMLPVREPRDVRGCRPLAKDMLGSMLVQDAFADDGKDEPRACVAADDRSQPDAERGNSTADDRNASTHRTQAIYSRRERTRVDGSAVDVAHGSRGWLDCGASDRRERSIDAPPEVREDRCRERDGDDRDRGGRGKSLHDEGERSGREEECVSEFARVDSVEILEPGSDGSFGGRAVEGRVYNFEVEGDHNFFAEGILTHNCHHYSADDWSELVRGYPSAIRLGFTATPMRSDGRGMAPAFDSLVVVSTIKELTALGYLVPCRVIAPAKPLRRPTMSHSPAEAYLAHANGMRTVVFADFVANAEKFVAEFREAGINAVIIHGQLSDTDRKAALAAHDRGAVLVNCMVLTEGWDSPATSCCILARGCGSVGTYLQIVGRVLRAAPRDADGVALYEKKEALLIDLTGRSFYDHGAPDDDRTYSLTGKGIRAKGENEEEQRYCPVCGQPVEAPPNSWPCGVCGHQDAGQIEAPRYTGDELAERYAGKRTEDEGKRIETLSRWLAEAVARKHKPWAALAKYKAVYGSDPSPSIRTAAESMAGSVVCAPCVVCGRVAARTYQGGKCGRCAFGKVKAG